ncbi:hypothetical protein F0562_025292 [Nyssa sinensis]|uniref:Uncharacterized protein n=1 Tax=Nyssa sinensis TaxID=561372 RepID=A0A5J5BF57_9ASTE|nr:hypothetical protein F0562_025292 [Nyssa sinensis]
MVVNASIIKADVVKFDGIENFELLQRRVKDLLVQQDFVKALYGKTKKLEKNDRGRIGRTRDESSKYHSTLSGRRVGIRANFPAMADETHIYQISDSLNHLKEDQDSQQQVLDEVVQQLNVLATGYESLSWSERREFGDGSTSRLTNCQ